jgi:hypothetical protein
MRRLLPWGFNIAVALSAVSCLATGVLWVRSISRLESIKYLRANGTQIELGTRPQGVELSRATNVPQEFCDFPPALRPRRGWSVSSHRLGSSDSFDSEPVHHPAPAGDVADLTFTHTVIVYDWSPPRRYFLGFAWNRTDFQANAVNCHIEYLTFPFWLMIAIFAAMPLSRLLPVIRRRCAHRRAAAGLCPVCGYDLRASTGRRPPPRVRNGDGQGPRFVVFFVRSPNAVVV